MSRLGVPTAFQDIEEAGEVCVRVGVRIDQRVAHARLGGEMDHVLEAVLREQLRHPGAVGEVELDEMEGRIFAKLVEPRLLERRVIIGVEVVEAYDRAAGSQQPARHVEADETGGAGDENRIGGHRRAHSRPSSMLAGLAARSSMALTSSTTPPPGLSSFSIIGQPPRT